MKTKEDIIEIYSHDIKSESIENIKEILRCFLYDIKEVSNKYKFSRKFMLDRCKRGFYKYMGGQDDFNNDLMATKEICNHVIYEFEDKNKCNYCGKKIRNIIKFNL